MSTVAAHSCRLQVDRIFIQNFSLHSYYNYNNIKPTDVCVSVHFPPILFHHHTYMYMYMMIWYENKLESHHFLVMVHSTTQRAVFVVYESTVNKALQLIWSGTMSFVKWMHSVHTFEILLNSGMFANIQWSLDLLPKICVAMLFSVA